MCPARELQKYLDDIRSGLEEMEDSDGAWNESVGFGVEPETMSSAPSTSGEDRDQSEPVPDDTSVADAAGRPYILTPTKLN